MRIVDKIKGFFSNVSRASHILYKSFGFGSMNATWSARQAYEFYKNVPELQSIINAQSNYFTNIKIEYVGLDGKPKESEVLKLLQNPNPYQDGKEFASSFYKIFNLNGIVFLYKDFNGLTYFSPNAAHLFCFSPADMTFTKKTTNTKPLKWTDIFEKITAKFPHSDDQIKLDLNNLTFFSESVLSLDDFHSGGYKIKAASLALDNLSAIYETENVIITNRGAAGIISPDGGTDSSGFNMPVTLSDDAQKEMNEQLGIFGTLIGKLRYIFAPVAVKFLNLIRTPQELGLEESRIRNKITIHDLWQHSILLSNELQGATFSNVKTIEARIYSNKIVPDSKKYVGFLNSNLNIEKGMFIINTSEIDALKEDDKLQAETAKINTEIIISLNTAVQENKLTKEIAVNILVSQGYTVEIASTLINDKIQVQNGTPI